MGTVRSILSRWFLPVLGVLSGGLTVGIVLIDPDDPILAALLEGGLALVLAGILVAIGYRYFSNTDLPEENAGIVAFGTLAGFGLMLVINFWFRFVKNYLGYVEPRFSALTSLTAGMLGGAMVGITLAQSRRRHAERERALADYHELFEKAQDGIIIHDPETGAILDVNERGGAILGYDSDELEGTSVGAISADDPEFDQERAEHRMQQAMGGEPQQLDWLVERKDGRTLWVEITLKRIQLGSDLRLIAFVRDISDRKEYEQELQARSEAIEASTDGIAILDEDEQYRFVNQAHADIYGYEDPGEMLGQSWHMCYGDAELERFAEEIEPTLYEQGSWRGEAAGQRKDGSTFPQELSLSVTENGGLVCVVRDITERKTHERHVQDLHRATREMVQQSEKEAVCEDAVRTAEQLLDFSTTSIWLADESGERLEPFSWSDRTEELFGELPTYTAGNSLSWQAYASGESFVFDDLQTETDMANPDTNVRSELVIPLGEYGVLNVGSLEPNAFSQNDVALAKLLAANTEVALERVERERDLRHQTEQMEFFNSILRHDVLNGITVIRSRAEFLTDELEGEQLQDAETIVRWSNDIVEIVQNVRTVLETLTGESDIQLERVDLAAELRREVERLRATYPAVDIETTIPDDAPVLANELLGEVLGNLVTNAVEHNETEGLRISITVEADEEDVTVRVADNGAGISEEMVDAIFRRGETGHAKSTGSGFGLFFVDAMMDEYDGDVRVEGNDAGGATFVLRFQSAVGTTIF